MNWLRKSLFAKLLIGMLLATVVPFLLSNLIAYQTSSSSMERQTIQLNHNSMDIMMNNVKFYFQDLDKLTGSFYVDTKLNQYLRTKQTSAIQTLYINEQVNSIYINRPEFYGIKLESEFKGQSFVSSDAGNAPLEKLITKKIDNNKPFQAMQMGNENILVLQKKLIDYPGDTSLGTLVAYIELLEIEKLLHSQLSDQEAYFLFINNEQELLYSTTQDMNALDAGNLLDSIHMGRGSQEGHFQGKDGVFISVQDSYLDMPISLVKFVPNHVIYKSAYETLNRTLFIQIIAIVFVVIFALILSYFMISPIKRLIRNMSQVRYGRFDIDNNTTRMDELGKLEKRFYDMVRDLDDLMNREYRYRLELSTAQLKMLQAQINPHFLYNTMQSISTMALKQGAYEINDKMAELGAILRYSMDIKTEVVTLESELTHIEHYMSLQMGRFKDKLTYNCMCPDELRLIEVPKMILQPLIENSIVHGVENGNGSGHIELMIEGNDTDETQQLIIRVIDNGKGMTEEHIMRLEQAYHDALPNDGQRQGIGLINVLQRLKLYYNGGFEWTLSSIPYEKTVITMIIDLGKSSGEEA